MLDEALEVLKIAGTVGGILTPIFLVYDRVIRYRPLAFLVAGDYKTKLCLKNIAAETIVIDEIKIFPPIIEVARANDLVTTNEEKAAVMYPTMADKKPKRTLIVIKAMGERSFDLHRFADFENADGKKAIKIRCRWKNTRKRFPIAQYVRVKTTVQEIRDLREASLAGKT
jgi:hypothetical protein